MTMYGANASAHPSRPDVDTEDDAGLVDEPDSPESYYTEPDLEAEADRAAQRYESAWYGNG